MEKAEYSKWLEKARKNTDVEKVVKTFFEDGEIFEGAMLNEEYDLNERIVCLLKQKGLKYEDIEDFTVEYSGTLAELFVEMGIKVGARLGVELLCENKKLG